MHLCIYENNGKSLHLLGFPGGSDGKESTSNAGYLGLIPESGRSPGEGTVLGMYIEYSSILAWRILRVEEPDRLWSMGSQRVKHD